MVYKTLEEEGKVAQNQMKSLAAKKASLSPIRYKIPQLTGGPKPFGAPNG